MFGDTLEEMLGKLFEDTDEPIFDVEVLSLGHRRRVFTSCCTYNYTGYGG